MDDLPSGRAAEPLAFAIYDRPDERPRDVVVRAFDLTGHDPTAPLPSSWIFPDIRSARRSIRAAKVGAVRIPRDPEEPLAIVETWL